MDRFSACDDSNFNFNGKSEYFNVYKLPYKTRRYLYLKRALDILISGILLIILLPLFLVISLLIKVTSKGPVIFKQVRLTKGMKEFKIYKFRTMMTKAPNVATAQLENPEEYVTKIGKILRKTSLDEVPQLWNVLKGDMSIVGPRPLIVDEGGDIHNIRNQNGVYNLRPGITGLAQVNGRDLVTDEEKAKYDTDYLYNVSLITDIKLLIDTVVVVFKREGISK